MKNIQYIIIMLIIIQLPVYSQWNQIGNNVYGDEIGDLSGKTLCLSGDGSTMVIGAYQNDEAGDNAGKVKVFRNINGNWVQIGSSLYGDNIGDWFGYTVSINYDGNIIAVSAVRNNSSSGQVKVFKYINNDWQQLGSYIQEGTGEGIGTTLDLNFDGYTIVVGAPSNSNNESHSGCTRVYTYIDSTWQQLGNNIYGEAADDYSGKSISINDNGKIIAIGASSNDGPENWDRAGHVRIFEYNANANLWVQMGFDIDGENAVDLLGTSVSLSGDGQTVAISATGYDLTYFSNGQVKIFSFIQGEWLQIGADIYGENSDALGTSVSLSSDGKTVAIGAAYNDDNGSNSGQVKIFHNNNYYWEQLGNIILGDSIDDNCGYVVSLSSEGNTIAVNSPGSISGTGCSRVFTINSYSFITDTVCDSFISPSGNYVWDTSGVYIDTIPNYLAYDSIITIDLTVTHDESIDFEYACNSYTWTNGITYTESNDTAKQILTNIYGCDSVITLNLTIQNSFATDNIEACDSYTWIDGNTYTENNNSATYTLTNIYGCDSVVNLNLTVNHSNVVTQAYTACNNFTWIDGITYTESNNTATYNLINQFGCDSTIMLNLTINNNTSTDEQYACSSYTWIDGNTYTQSNNSATYILVNSFGCDSVVTLNLTIHNNDTIIETQYACNSYTWIDGITYSENNNSAIYTTTNYMGCDSIIKLNLIINNTDTTYVSQTACKNFTWIDGNIYTESNNNITYTLPNYNGCDSIIILDLEINTIDASVSIQTNENGLQLVANADNAEYQWLYCDSVFTQVDSENNQVYTPLADGDYAVIVDNDICIDTSFCYNIMGIGVQNIESNSTFILYPNPANNYITVYNPKQIITEVVIYDIVGKIITNLSYNNNIYKRYVDLKELNQGVYLIKLKTQNGDYTQRFIKQ